jgi:hypothetical protein
MNKIWKTFKTKYAKYKISNNGEIYSFNTKKLLKMDNNGRYKQTTIDKRHIRIDRFIFKFFNKSELTTDFLTYIELCKNSSTQRRPRDRELHKKQLIEWINKHNRMPSKNSIDIEEKACGRDMDNYCCKFHKYYDQELHNLLITKYGRRTWQKAHHNPEKVMQEVIDFIKEHKRAPSAQIPEERRIWRSMWNYAGKHVPLKNEVFIKKLHELDKCFGTYIACKYRRSINEGLGNQKLTIEELKVNAQKETI